MIQLKDLVFGEWRKSYNGKYKYRESEEVGTKFMSLQVTEYDEHGKRHYSLSWSGYAFQMEAEYGHDHVEGLPDEDSLNKAIAKEVYGRIEWLKEESDKFLAL